MATKLEDSEIAEILYMSNVGEVKEAQAVVDRLTRPSAVDLADQIIKDHRIANQTLTWILVEAAVERKQSETSAAIAKGATGEVDRLLETPRSALDFEYVRACIEDHKHLLHIVDTELAPNVREPKLARFIAAMRSDVQNHIALAERVQRELPPAVD